MLFSPDIAFTFLIIGIFGILFEITTPGTTFPGVIGTICLILAIYAFSFFEINYYGISLLAIALILFVFEVKIISYGVLTLFGVIAFSIGSYYLIEKSSGMSISISFIIVASCLLIAFSILLLYLGLNAQKTRKSTGSESLLGSEAIVSSEITPEKAGEIIHLGERWRANSSENISKGEKVLIEKVSGLTVFVKKI